jgi:hypothetical protein
MRISYLTQLTLHQILMIVVDFSLQAALVSGMQNITVLPVTMRCNSMPQGPKTHIVYRPTVTVCQGQVLYFLLSAASPFYVELV